MKITSNKAGTARHHKKVEHQGEVRSIGYNYMEKNLMMSFMTETRHVTVHIPDEEMERIIKQYQEYKAGM